MLADIDRFCGQIAAAIHGSELQLYATLAVIVVLSALLFPPKDDPEPSLKRLRSHTAPEPLRFSGVYLRNPEEVWSPQC